MMNSQQVVYEMLVPTVNEWPAPWLYGWTLGVAYPLPTEGKEILEKYKLFRTTAAPTTPPPTPPHPEYHDWHMWDEYMPGPPMISGGMNHGKEAENKIFYYNNKNKQHSPHKSYYYKDYHGYSVPHEVRLHRRHRRDLYLRLESLLMGARLGGRACVLRALCEAGQRPEGAGRRSFVAELLHTLFTLPPALEGTEDPDALQHEREALEHFDAAHAATGACRQRFPQCTASLFELWSGQPLAARDGPL
ncbi:hypothetical protein R5R35_011102 [Gryllus longicercus]|uniref:Uncharacterized protein n=1 Tax=Gryllus longicercus TaxID=2509291 RepID=A0AAN9VTS3_9ORTH